MRFLPTQAHGYVDYIVGVVLIIAPWLLGFAAGGAETWVPVILGLALIVYSLLSDYELGAAKVIPANVHLGMDVVLGIILAVSPWLFGFAALVWAPHLIVGLVMIAVGVLTETTPRRGAGEHRERHRPAA